MTKYSIENVDGGLRLESNDHLEWLGDIEIVSFPSESVICVRVTLCDSNDSNLHAWSVEGADDIRLDMNEWLEDEGYSISIPCDFADEKSVAGATADAITIRDRFLSGDYVPLDARYRVWWVSEGKQGSLECGDFITLDEARASLPEMTAELLRVDGGCSPEGILAGTFSIDCTRGNDGYGVEERFDVADFAPVPAAA